MDQEIRTKLRSVVTQCRKLLEDSVSQELEGKYGIFAKKDQVAADPNAKMTHLTEEEQAARKDILDHFGHITARGFKPKESLDQLVREIAFTHLNRLCAYKMMEAREVYIGEQKFREAVSRSVNSNGVKFYLADHPEEERLFNTGRQDVAYRHFLDWLGGLLSDEIGVLFNPNDPANRLYPRQKTLDEVLDLLNGGGIKAEEKELREEWPKIWSQDETIGWVYQYFTPKELRDQARKESSAPRNSYELAFRNQFFTPRYVVEFLTDNTLGRIWYEMRKGNTKLKDQCRYMVRHPAEIFLNEGQQPPKDAAEGRDDLSQEELLSLPVHIPHRPKKDPRELKILDPACGSGHFLLYCFDLLLTIYLEAYADSDLGPALQKDYPTLEDLLRDVPRLILAHNLHGIDIDLRCTQIAALALWLRCQRAYQEMGLKKDRPQIKRSNFVCAEPMPGEQQMLKEFVGQLEPKLLGQVVEVVFDKMKLAGEAGSLLKIEEEIQGAVAEAKRQFDMGGLPVQQTFFDKPVEAGEKRFSVKGLTDASFFEQAEAKVIEALRQYTEKAQNGQRLQRRLFTDDALQGFAFVDVCHQRFDVLLMNPPFGSPSLIAENYLHSSYPDSRFEIYGQFLIRAAQMSVGYVGALTSRGFLFLSNFLGIRESVYPFLSVFLDLGGGILDDAFVEVCALTLSTKAGDTAICIDNRSGSVFQEFDNLRPVVCNKSLLQSLEKAPFCYDTSPSILRLFGSGEGIETALNGLARVGLATGDNERFVRCHWEVPPSTVNRRWKPYSKGGEYLPFKSDVHLLVDWSEDGKVIERSFGGARIHKSDVYFRPGVTYSLRSLKGLSFRVLPSGCICSNKGPVLIAPGYEFAVLALTNSALFKYMVNIQCSASAFEIGTVQRTPFPPSFKTASDTLAEFGRALTREFSVIATIDETAVDFDLSLPFEWKPSISKTAQAIEDEFASRKKTAGRLLCELDECVERLYGVSKRESPKNEYQKMVEPLEFVNAKDRITRLLMSLSVGYVLGRWDQRSFLARNRNDDPFREIRPCSPAMLQGVDGLPVTRLPEGYPLRIDWDGILLDDAEHRDDILRRVQDVLEVMWKGRADAIEKEACEILGVKEFRDYFRKPGKGGFWDDHVSRYSKSRRKAPIYWLLQSSKKNYALWLYYHRLDKDLLFKSLVNYVEPKFRLESSRLETLRNQKAAAGESGKEAKRLAKEVERQEDFLSELRDFEDKLRRAANLHLEPDLNDGVVLNIAPLHELVPWKEAKNYWEELLEGKYEWSSVGKQLQERGLVK